MKTVYRLLKIEGNDDWVIMTLASSYVGPLRPVALPAGTITEVIRSNFDPTHKQKRKNNEQNKSTQ